MQVSVDAILGTTILAGCLYTMFSGYAKEKFSKKEENNLSELVSLQGTEVTAEYTKPYSCLCFDSAEDFISSLQFLMKERNTYIKSTVYDKSNNVLAYNYVSKDGKILVMTESSGKISCCKFKGVLNADKFKDLMHSKLNKSSFCYKDTSDGFVLEPRSTY